MIYDVSSIDDPIRQGDIFIGLPRVDISLSALQVVSETGDGCDVRDWRELFAAPNPIEIVSSVRAVPAIVATQNCDASRSTDITLCEIGPLATLYPTCAETQKPNSWVSIITQQSRLNMKWFYLPPSTDLGFDKKMAVDFLTTLRVPRIDLEGLRSLRKGRLNDYAEQHFRERLADFFRRYPYDEWYSLNHSELDAYRKNHVEVVPFSWQSDSLQDG